MIFLPYIEVSVVGHCNLKCRACNHGSPIAPRNLVNEKDVLVWLSKLSEIGLHAGKCRVLGGEPLLHPNIIGVINAVKESGVTKSVEIVTNGTLLAKQTEEFWQAVDSVAISVYPGIKCSFPWKHGAKVVRNQFPIFTETFSTQPHESSEEVKRVYDGCRIRKSAIGVVDGKFWRCMRAPFLDDSSGGLELSTATPESLAAYLKEGDPLKACWKCTGSFGNKFPHQQLNKDEWIRQQDRPLHEMISR